MWGESSTASVNGLIALAAVEGRHHRLKLPTSDLMFSEYQAVVQRRLRHDPVVRDLCIKQTLRAGKIASASSEDTHWPFRPLISNHSRSAITLDTASLPRTDGNVDENWWPSCICSIDSDVDEKYGVSVWSSLLGRLTLYHWEQSQPIPQAHIYVW